MWPIGFDDVVFQDAIDWFLGRTLVTRPEWDAMAEAARKKAFMVSGVAQLDVISDVWRALDHAIRDGRTFADFKTDIGAKLEAAWAGTVKEPATRLETIFRTNVQLAYSAGRYRQLTQPDTLSERPIWKYSAILDSRVTPVCKVCNGTILPADHPFWATHIPPLHFNCRSAVIALTEEQAHEQGGMAKAVPAADAQSGFGRPPGTDDWAPNPADYSPELWRIYKSKEPAVPPAHTPEHWEPQYAHFGDAAKALAWGRASEERGLDLPLSAVREHLEAIGTPIVGHALSLLQVAETTGTKLDTMRAALAWAKGLGGADVVLDGLRVAALYAGHRHAIQPVGSLDAKVTFPRKDPERALAKANYAACARFLGSMIAKSVKTGPVRVSFSTKRGFFNPAGKISASYRGNVLEHEWGHALEHFNPEIAKRAATFLRVRTEGEPIIRLRDATGIHAYGTHERTRRDKFRSAYVGKLYASAQGETYATEVTSMGLEWLASPEAAIALREDPEHVYFTLGQLAGIR